MLIPLQKRDCSGFATKCVAVTSSALSLQKKKPNCLKKPSPRGKPQTPHNPFATNTENLQRCAWSKISRKQITEDPSSYAPIKQNPALSGLGATLNPLQNQTAATTFRAPYVKSRKKEKIKIACSSTAPKVKKIRAITSNGCPKKKKKNKKQNHRTGFAGYSEWLGEEKTNRRTDIINPIPFKDGFCGTVLF